MAKFSLNIQKDKGEEEIASLIASSINKKLQLDKKVLLFVSGGSAIPMEVLVGQKVGEFREEQLTVTLADERYGGIDYSESNWFKLKKMGFNFKRAHHVPYLEGKDVFTTVRKLNNFLEKELKRVDYRIGILGLGEDGHTAGILPNSPAIDSEDYVCYYEAPPYKRITITRKTIMMFDEVFVYASGKNKWPVIEKLKEDISIINQPAQILKNVPLLTIFTNNK